MRYSEHINFKLADEVCERVDAFAAEASTPWHHVSRSEALRTLTSIGLNLIEPQKMEAQTS